MSEHDTDAVLEEVAKDLCERSTPPVNWEDLDAFTKYLSREKLLPVVTATLRAIDKECGR